MKKLIKQFIALVIFITLFFVLNFIKNNAAISDFYVRYISSNYVKVLNIIFGWIPFTIYELTLVFIVLFILICLIKSIISLFKKEWVIAGQKFVKILLFLAICVDYYMATASISYGRSEVPVPQYTDTVSQELIDSSFDYYINDYNSIAESSTYDENGFLVSPYTLKETNDLISKEFEKLDSNYFNPYTGKVKYLVASNIFTELHFTGITWAPSGEITVNRNIHASELCHTIAHEIVHSKGVYREDDANLVALYVLLTSDNDYLRFCAYHAGFSSLLQIYALTDYQKYYDSYFALNEKIRKEYSALNEYWGNHDILSKIGNWYNNLFLKANGNENGTDDYNDNSESEDTGETDETNHPIHVITQYSPYQKLFFYNYLYLINN